MSPIAAKGAIRTGARRILLGQGGRKKRVGAADQFQMKKEKVSSPGQEHPGDAEAMSRRRSKKKSVVNVIRRILEGRADRIGGKRGSTGAGGTKGGHRGGDHLAK